MRALVFTSLLMVVISFLEIFFSIAMYFTGHYSGWGLGIGIVAGLIVGVIFFVLSVAMTDSQQYMAETQLKHLNKS